MYGSAEEVAALSPLWTEAGAFTTTTSPTLAQVENWLTQVSSMMDTCLAKEGFVTPVTDADATPDLDLIVSGMVKDIVDFSRKSGRFYTKKALDSDKTMFMKIASEMCQWVKENRKGLERKGATLVDGAIGSNMAYFDVL